MIAIGKTRSVSCLYSVYLCSCLSLVLFMSNLFDPFYIFSLIFIIFHHIISLKQTRVFFAQFSERLIIVLNDNMDEESKQFSKSTSTSTSLRVLLSFWLIFLQFQRGVAYKVLLKGACYWPLSDCLYFFRYWIIYYQY